MAAERGRPSAGWRARRVREAVGTNGAVWNDFSYGRVLLVRLAAGLPVSTSERAAM